MIAGDHDLSAAVATAWSGGPPVARFPITGSPLLAKVTVRLDGLGSAMTGTATVGGTLKDPDGATVAGSSDLTIAHGDEEAWLDLDFTDDPPLLDADGVWAVELAVTAGESTVPRWLKVTPAFDGGGDNVASFATVFAAFETLADPAGLPFAEAQALLARGGRDGAGRRTTLGWHGSASDPTVGSYALVSPDGELAGTAGRVLRIARADGGGGGSIYALVLSDQADIEDPVTVTRTLFQRLALASDYDVPVSVEVVPR